MTINLIHIPLLYHILFLVGHDKLLHYYISMSFGKLHDVGFSDSLLSYKLHMPSSNYPFTVIISKYFQR